LAELIKDIPNLIFGDKSGIQLLTANIALNTFFLRLKFFETSFCGTCADSHFDSFENIVNGGTNIFKLSFKCGD